jgi:hypothetical protein
LVERFPYYAFATIPGNTYASLQDPISTFGVLATVVTSADLEPAVVYEVVRAVFENFDDFKAMHPAFSDLDPRRMVRDGLSAPLHRKPSWCRKGRGSGDSRPASALFRSFARAKRVTDRVKERSRWIHCRI